MSMKDKKVLVTGGTGFIGSHLCRRLLEEGVNLFVLVKYNSVIDNIRLASVWDRITPIEADLRNSDSLMQLNQIKPEIIFHLAAYNHVGDSFTHISEAIDSNGKGTVNLLEAYNGYDRFVYVSSSEVYGHQEIIPFHETSYPYPLSPYAVGKYVGEVYSLMKNRSEGKPISVVRPFNAYGPYQSSRAITAEIIIKCLKGEDIVTTEGLQTREFNYVSDLVSGMLLASVKPESIGEVINIGCGEETRIRDLVITIHELCRSKSRLRIGELEPRIGDIQRMVADNTKAKNLLGWCSEVDHETGLLKTIEWFKKYLAVFSDTNSHLARLSG